MPHPRGHRKLRVRLDVYDSDGQTYRHIPGSARLIEGVTSNRVQNKIVRRILGSIKEIERELLSDRTADRGTLHSADHAPDPGRR